MKSMNGQYEKKLTVLTREFADDFCLADGTIDWDKIVKYNSGVK